MSLASTLAQSKKISPDLAHTLEGMEHVPPAEKSLTVIFSAVAGLKKEKIEGVTIRSDIGTIYTAEVSLEGIHSLVKDTRVVSIQGSGPLYSEAKPNFFG